MTITTALLLGYASVLLASFAHSFTWARARSMRLYWVRLLLLGAAYDNVAVAIGPWAVGSDWYVAFNHPRYYAHSILLPFLVVFGASAMRAAGVPVARRRGFMEGCYVLAALGVTRSVLTKLLDLELVVTERLGHPCLSLPPGSAPPIPTIVANLLVLPMALAIWRRTDWPWFFAGALFILVVNGAAAGREWAFLAGNAAEVVFLPAMLATERHLQRLG